MPHLNPKILLNVLKKHLEALYDIYTECVNNSISDQILNEIERLTALTNQIEDLVKLNE